MSGGKRARLQEHIMELIEPLLERENYELVEVEIVGKGPGTILRLYIDKPGGVTLDDCAHVSQAVDPMLDVEDPFDTPYSLEVSSPGLDRPLRKPADFERFVGRRIRLKTYGPIEGAGKRKVFPGILTGFENDRITVDVDGQTFEIERSEVAKANLVYEFED